MYNYKSYIMYIMYNFAHSYYKFTYTASIYDRCHLLFWPKWMNPNMLHIHN